MTRYVPVSGWRTDLSRQQPRGDVTTSTQRPSNDTPNIACSRAVQGAHAEPVDNLQAKDCSGLR